MFCHGAKEAQDAEKHTFVAGAALDTVGHNFRRRPRNTASRTSPFGLNKLLFGPRFGVVARLAHPEGGHPSSKLRRLRALGTFVFGVAGAGHQLENRQCSGRCLIVAFVAIVAKV
jgi:hypothetical protein